MGGQDLKMGRCVDMPFRLPGHSQPALSLPRYVASRYLSQRQLPVDRRAARSGLLTCAAHCKLVVQPGQHLFLSPKTRLPSLFVFGLALFRIRSGPRLN